VLVAQLDFPRLATFKVLIIQHGQEIQGSKLGFPSLGHKINMFKIWLSKPLLSILQDMAFQVLVIKLTCSRPTWFAMETKNHFLISF
jgi:hypothetical protein